MREWTLLYVSFHDVKIGSFQVFEPKLVELYFLISLSFGQMYITQTFLKITNTI